MNESVKRSPKWLRNFIDFEINTGEDIKGEPSKRRQKKVAERERIDREERLKRERIQREKRREREEEERKESERINQQEFNSLWNDLYTYISRNYEDCVENVFIPRNDLIEITTKNLTHSTKGIIKVVIKYDNSYRIPKFNVTILNNKDIILYSYDMSGILYSYVRDFVYAVYRWWDVVGKTKNQKYERPKQKAKPKPKKNETDPDKNRLRRYNLLKKTLQGYQRQMIEIMKWEIDNKKYHSDRKVVENEMEAVERRINQMKKDYSFETLNIDFIELNLVEIENRINNIKTDLGINL